MKDKVADFLQKIAGESYPEPRTSGHDYITERIAPTVTELLPTGARVLDVGSGQGCALEWFKANGVSAIGIDVNEENLRECWRIGFAVFRYDQNDMPEDWTGKFDCVWARHVLEHSGIPYFTIMEFSRVLKTGGVLYVEVPAPDTACKHETNLNHYSVMGVCMWASLIKRAGFEILVSQTITMGTPVGPDAYFSIIAKKLS